MLEEVVSVKLQLQMQVKQTENRGLLHDRRNNGNMKVEHIITFKKVWFINPPLSLVNEKGGKKRIATGYFISKLCCRGEEGEAAVENVTIID